MFVFVVFLCLAALAAWRATGSSLRDKFTNKFEEKCLSLALADRYGQLLQIPSEKRRYTLFVFHEAGQSLGGFGDRLAGIINAMAYSLRFNRTLLITADASFEEYFLPYEPAFTDISASEIPVNRTWAHGWPWAGENIRELLASESQVLHCINPRPNRQGSCALDRDSDARIVKIYSNRSYLCRWAVNKQLGLTDQLKEALGVESHSDLLQIAGCLLRLAMWPSEQLWRDVEQLYNTELAKLNLPSATEATHQIGVHFRCGDSSFTTPHRLNPECVYVNESTWKGTSFADDRSIDSPVELAQCANEILVNRSASASQQLPTAVVYIASDNSDSAKQIHEHIDWKYVIRPSAACHVDLQSSNRCSSFTLMHWFLLSLSDTFITQSLLIDDPNSIYHDPPTGEPLELGPISAFSRYAAIYGLSTTQLHFGHNCHIANSHKLSLQTSGNWVCRPKRFF